MIPPNEIITIRFTRTAYGVTVPLTKEVAVADALTALNRLLAQPNTYRLEFQGQRIVSLVKRESGLTVNGETDMGGNIWYSHPIGSSRDLSQFIQGLIVTQLLPNPDGDLSAMYPISVEAWL